MVSSLFSHPKDKYHVAVKKTQIEKDRQQKQKFVKQAFAHVHTSLLFFFISIILSNFLN